jgi:hypothetical protein
MKNQPFPIDGNWPAADVWMKGVDSGQALTSDQRYLLALAAMVSPDVV